MSQTTLEIQLQILIGKAKSGDPKAISELADLAFQFINGDSVPQNTTFGRGLLENLKNYGDKTARDELAKKIDAFAIKISEIEPTISFQLFSLSNKLGNLNAKRNLAVCLFNGKGTQRQPNKVLRLLKECYEEGIQSVLEDMNTMAKKFLHGDNGIAPDSQKAIELFTFAAQAGHVLALENLVLLGAWFYHGISPCPQDIPQGIAIFKISAKLGDKAALYSLGVAGSEMLETDPKVGFELLTLASELGHLKSKRNLAICFFNGEGTERQPNKVMPVLKECYEAGNQSALEDMNTMAKKFLDGDSGITPDLQKAVELFTFAAQAGHALALENLVLLGAWFYHGISPCPQDIPQGIAIFKMTAKLGNARALHSLAIAGSEILETDPKVGFELLTVASELGDLEAKRDLAVCFFNGQGTERKPDKVIGLLKECYEQGNQSVLTDMDTMAGQFLYGYGGITIDLQKAVEFLTFAAEAGHTDALKNLAILGGWFYSGISPCLQDIPQGIVIFKITAKLGDKVALHNLGVAGAEMLETDPKVGFELLTLATELGNLGAKRNLAVCFLDGTGTDKDINQAISLLKACYVAGNSSALDDINTIAARFLLGLDECQKDLERSIKLFAYTAQRGNQKARYNLRVLANHFLAWQKFEQDYGIQQDIPKGLRILHYLANTLQDTAANEQLTQIRALNIPVPMPNVSETGPRLTSHGLTIGPSTPEAPHSPCTAAFLRRNNIFVSASGIRIQGNHFSFSSEEISRFRTDRSAEKLAHFTSVLNALRPHFSPTPVQGIICDYLPEVPPIFFQYQRALEAVDSKPALECLNTEETSCDISLVKLYA